QVPEDGAADAAFAIGRADQRDAARGEEPLQRMPDVAPQEICGGVAFQFLGHGRKLAAAAGPRNVEMRGRLLASELPDGRALAIADAVVLLHVDELALDAEPRQLGEDVAVGVEVAGTRGALVVDGLALQDELDGACESRDPRRHRLALAIVD